jgi:serine protease Do
MRAFLLSLVIVAGCTPTRGLLPETDFTEVVRREAGAVVSIGGGHALRPALPDLPLSPEAEEDEEYRDFLRGVLGADPWLDTRSRGSGFVISSDGFIVTNAHLLRVAGSGDVVVRLADRREFEARVVGLDPASDIGVLKIEASGLHSVRIADPRRLHPGQSVAAIGSPFGFESSVSAGIVSGIGRTIPEESFVPFIQTDVAVNPGNSGGPLFNLRGEVVGVNSGMFSATGGYMGVSFAIPIDIAMEVARELRAHGKVVRGRIGVSLQELTAELAAALRLPDAAGALVVDVHKDGPAELAGLAAADVVVSFDGRRVQHYSDLVRYTTQARPGALAEIGLLREGRALGLKVRVAEANVDAPATAPGVTRGDPLGLRVAPLDPRGRLLLGLAGGVLVRHAAGAAQRAGLMPGDVILSVNGKPALAVEAFERLIEAAGAGATVALLVQRGFSRNFLALRLP